MNLNAAISSVLADPNIARKFVQSGAISDRGKSCC
jgi:hypothetical protein